MARRWRKRSDYGTVVLPNGRVLSRSTDIVEGDQYAKIAREVGLEEVLDEPKVESSGRQLLVDNHVGSRVVLVETEPAPVANLEVALTESPKNVVNSQPPVATTMDSVDGVSGTGRRRRGRPPHNHQT